jgi:predicted nucleotidyltransferase
MILFGSHATGVPRDDSDIDVVVISPDFTGRGIWDRITLISPALWASEAPIEAIPMTPDEWESGQSYVVAFASHGIDV